MGWNRNAAPAPDTTADDATPVPVRTKAPKPGLGDTASATGVAGHGSLLIKLLMEQRRTNDLLELLLDESIRARGGDGA
jgi:hypothetical protein